VTTFLGQRTHTRRRFAPDTYVDGVPVRGAVTESPVVGSLQPLRERDRQVLPEGIRNSDLRKIYCDRDALRTEDQHAGTKADELVDARTGIRFVVVHADDSHEEIEHGRYFLQRVQEGQP
jgi:hypothetical protein